MSKKLEISNIQSNILIRILYEQLDINNIREASGFLEEQFEENQVYILDFEEVNFIDSSGLGGLIKIKKSLTNMESDLYIINLNPRVDTIMQLTQTNKFLNCIGTLDEALQKLENDDSV